MMTKVVPNIFWFSSVAHSWIILAQTRFLLGRQSWSIFLVLTSMVCLRGQVADDFTASELNSIWQGDREQFIITDAGQLRLDADQASPSYLSTSIQVVDSFQWEMTVRLAFAPSGSNKLDIALIAEESNIVESDGLFLRIGQAGSDDAVSLYRRASGDITIVAQGEPGEIATNPFVSFQLNLEEGRLSVKYDLSGGRNYQSGFELDYPDELGGSGYFGWICNYTSTRSDKFFFDNFYAGSIQVDTESPKVTGTLFTNKEVCVNFSEAIDPAAVIANQSVIISPDVTITDFKVEDNSLKISGDFLEDTRYYVDLIDITDFSGNGLDTTIQITKASPIKVGELLINEVLFNPRGNGPDYLELYNNGSRAIPLSGLRLTNSSNGDDDIYNGIALIQPEGYAVLTLSPSDVINSYSSSSPANIYTAALPRMSNDAGNITISAGGVVIDAFDYTDDLHIGSLDDEDGVSLERISLQADTQDESNWTSAASFAGFGTPGMKNSSATRGNTRVSFTKQQNVISQSGLSSSTQLGIYYVLDKPGYIGAVEVFDEYGNGRGYVFQNESLSVSGKITWDGICDNNEKCQVGIYILSIRLFHQDGSSLERRITIGISE